jgi:hypothetical protein
MRLPFYKGMEVSTDLTGTFTVIPNVLEVDLPEVNPDVVEYTFVDATDSWPTKKVKKISMGDLRLKVQYDATLHSDLDQAAETGLSEAKKIKIVWSGFGNEPHNYRAYEFAAIRVDRLSCKYGETPEREYVFHVNKPITIGS